MIEPMVALLLGALLADRPPEIARAAGIVVGLTTVQEFERRHRGGLVETGGHPRGARVWYEETQCVEIDADGFNFRRSGEVIDELSLTWERPGDCPSNVPRIRLRKNELGMLAKLHAGMTELEVDKALRVRLKSGGLVQTGLIRYKDKLVNKMENGDRYTRWKAQFDFDDSGGLQSVSIVGD